MKYAYLNKEFFKDYPTEKYPEISRKIERPYVVLDKTINGKKILLPLRSNINHKHVFWTNKKELCGIDYSKALIVSGKYIDKNKPKIRNEEHSVIIRNKYNITQGFIKYMNDYQKAVKNPSPIHNSKLLQYSSLKYFNEEMSLSKTHLKNRMINLYKGEYPAIKYISIDSALIINKMNQKANKVLSIKELKEEYKKIGMKLDKEKNPYNNQCYKDLETVIDDLKMAQLKSKEIEAIENAKSLILSKEIELE